MTFICLVGFGEGWPYARCQAYVCTRNTDFAIKTENNELLNIIDESTIKAVRTGSNKNIWIIGGGELITTFLNNDAIDDMILTIIPILLGKGIRLFPNEPKETRFDLVKTDSFEGGVVNLTYCRK